MASHFRGSFASCSAVLYSSGISHGFAAASSALLMAMPLLSSGARPRQSRERELPQRVGHRSERARFVVLLQRGQPVRELVRFLLGKEIANHPISEAANALLRAASSSVHTGRRLSR